MFFNTGFNLFKKYSRNEAFPWVMPYSHFCQFSPCWLSSYLRTYETLNLNLKELLNYAHWHSSHHTVHELILIVFLSFLESQMMKTRYVNHQFFFDKKRKLAPLMKVGAHKIFLIPFNYSADHCEKGPHTLPRFYVVYTVCCARSLVICLKVIIITFFQSCVQPFFW